MEKLIGRELEQRILQETLESRSPELIALFGRRREGAQIDLLIDRKDFVINICEIKYSEREFIIDKAYSAELENKKDVFVKATGTRKTLFLTMITTFGILSNAYATQSIQATVTMEALFA